MGSDGKQGPSAWWIRIVMAVVLIPALAAPALLGFISADNAELRVLVWLFPLYAGASVVFARICLRGGRPTIAWVLLALAALSDVALAALARMMA